MDTGLWRAVRVAGVTLALLALGATSAGAQAAPDESGANGSDDWKVIQTIDNNSPYEMRLVMTTTTDMSTYTDPPKAKIAAGGTDQMRAKSGAPGHGVVVLAAYDLFDVRPGPDVYKGMVLVRSGIDCADVFSIRGQPTCLDYTRWNRADVDSGGAVSASWWNNGGAPEAGFYTQTDIQLPRQGGSTGAQIDPDSVPPEGSSPEEEPAPNGQTWSAITQIHNRSGYQMRARASWNSEYSHYDPAYPGTIASGSDGDGTIKNSQFGHGPQSVVMWDLIDPATNQYRASVLTYAAVECVAALPRAGCVDYHNVGKAFAGGSGRTTAKAELTTDGAPSNLYVEFFFDKTNVPVGSRPGETEREVRDDNTDDDGLDDSRAG